MKEKPQVIRKVIEGNEIVIYEAKLEVTATGNSAHVTLPKKLIGKRVLVTFKEVKK